MMLINNGTHGATISLAGKAMVLNRRMSWLGVFVALFLVGCSSSENFPLVKVKPNASTIEIGAIKEEEPSWLIGKSWDEEGNLNHPDIPARTVISVKRVQSLHNKEPRYFIPASGVAQVVSIENYSDYGRTAALEEWRKLTRSSDQLGDAEQRMLYKTQLSEVPWMNAGRCFHAKLRKVRFPWGDAVLFLTTYVQGSTGGPVNNDMLVLVAQGLTKDGRYAVNAHFEIHHPQLPNSAEDERRQGLAFFPIDEESEKAERWLDGQPDDAFSPTIGQYEQFLSSLEISKGKPIRPAE